MHYEVRPGADVGRAQLSAEAQARYDAYRLTHDDLVPAPAGGLAVLNSVFDAGSGKTRFLARPAAEEEEREPSSVEGMGVVDLRGKMQRALREKPTQLNAFFADLNREIKKEKAVHGDEEVYQFLKALKPAVPPPLWVRHGLEAELGALEKTR
jgi:hypothetical protein